MSSTIGGADLFSFSNGHCDHEMPKPDKRESQTRAEKMKAFLTNAFRICSTFLCLMQVAYFPMACVIWNWMFLPVRWYDRSLFNRIFNQVTDVYSSTWGYCIELAGHSVYECGDDYRYELEEPGAVLLMTNHQCLVDIFTVARFLQARRPFSRVTWIMEFILQFSPMGPGLKQRGDFFVLEKNDTKLLRKYLPFHNLEKMLNEQPEKLRKTLLTNIEQNDRKVISIFPEGGFLHKRRAGSQRFARANNLPVLENVALPRMGATNVIMETLFRESENPEHRLKYILDATIGYQKCPHSLINYFFKDNNHQKTVVHFRLIPVKDFAGTAAPENLNLERLAQNMRNLYVDKDDLLQHFYEHGEFPLTQSQRPETPCNPVKVPRLLVANVLAFLTCYCFARFVWSAFRLLF